MVVDGVGLGQHPHHEIMIDNVEALRTTFADNTRAGPIVQDIVFDEAVVCVIEVNPPTEGHGLERAKNGVSGKGELIAVRRCRCRPVQVDELNGVTTELIGSGVSRIAGIVKRGAVGLIDSCSAQAGELREFNVNIRPFREHRMTTCPGHVLGFDNNVARQVAHVG